ncbi:hypothetical protein PSR1_02126 [Anaeromyxobacter sp. PSR-1]|nr:hypothetical protein PSR1_02126 [Anaeromyxobacter sp. PSR-1]
MQQAPGAPARAPVPQLVGQRRLQLRHAEERDQPDADPEHRVRAEAEDAALLDGRHLHARHQAHAARRGRAHAAGDELHERDQRGLLGGAHVDAGEAHRRDAEQQEPADDERGRRRGERAERPVPRGDREDGPRGEPAREQQRDGEPRGEQAERQDGAGGDERGAGGQAGETSPATDRNTRPGAHPMIWSTRAPRTAASSISTVVGTWNSATTVNPSRGA